MTTLACHNCHRDNPAGRGFCQFCGSRLALNAAAASESNPKPLSDPAETVHLLRETVQLLREELRASSQEIAALKLELESARQKIVSDTLRDSEQRISEESRLRASLAESETTVAALKSELQATNSHGEQLSSVGQHLQESFTQSEQTIATLKRELDLAREKASADALREAEMRIAEETRLKDSLTASTETIAALRKDLEAASAVSSAAAPLQDRKFREDLAASEKVISALKQQLDGVTEKLSKDHEIRLAQKDSVIEELRSKIQNFVELENTVQTSAARALSGIEAGQGETGRRRFGAMAMAIVAMLSSGAGGIGGYYYHGDDGGAKVEQTATNDNLKRQFTEAENRNRELQDELKSRHDDYESVKQDLKKAEDQLKAQASAGAGSNDDVQRQLTELRAINQELQKRIAAITAELDQRRQEVVARDQTIVRLNQDLHDAKAQEAKPQETKDSRPKPRRTPDVDTMIRNLEREFGVPTIGR